MIHTIRKSKLQILTPVSIIFPFKGHSFMTFANWKILTVPPLTSTVIQFWSARPSAVPQLISIIESRSTPSSEKQYFKIFLISFNSKINILIVFFFAEAHIVYKFHKYNKTDRKASTHQLSLLSWSAFVLLLFLQMNCKLN